MKKITFPTWITILRIVLVVPFVMTIMWYSEVSLWLALGIFLLASFSDFLDGFLARKFNLTSDMGAFLDPLADKILVNTAFICFAVLGMVPYFVPMIFIARDFMVDGVRMAAARSGKTISAAWAGKWKTAVQMVAIVILIMTMIFPQILWLKVGSVLTGVALVLSVWSGVEYLTKWVKKR